ncbi:hypothetical protein LB524_17210 [Mesorhizobium sp. ESP6-5]|uniref:hypothetical protein n=1 Tax=unclassified Mesorhizobium TaxID=325217 RepID=UPI0015EE9688|nr:MULTISPECIES: hypothetical protein [unclassified Mesorhizobium]MBZ9757028.1 hypothetical protein [Mesorhizobium sp. ESP6-5]
MFKTRWLTPAGFSHSALEIRSPSPQAPAPAVHDQAVHAEDLPQIALIDPLTAVRAVVEVKMLFNMLPSMQFAGNRRAKVR